MPEQWKNSGSPEDMEEMYRRGRKAWAGICPICWVAELRGHKEEGDPCPHIPVVEVR